jgi:hypothetical protein
MKKASGRLPPRLVEVALRRIDGRGNMQRVSCLVMGSLLLLSTVQNAAAGCPNQCKLKVDQPRIEPEISCITINDPEADDCDCEVRLFVHNDCEQSIEPQGFSLTFCGNDVRRCTVIEPDDYGVISIPLTKVGPEEHVFSIHVGDAEAAITTNTEVESFDEGGCACTVQGRTSPSPPWVALSLAALGWTLSRRLRRTENARL